MTLVGDHTMIKSIASDVYKECSKSDTPVDMNFIEFYIKLMTLNPEYGKFLAKGSKKIDGATFVEHCIKKLSDEKDPSNLMMRMQLIFQNDFDTVENLIAKNQNSIDKRTEPLVREIIHARPGSKEEFEKLLRRISIYLVLKSGLGNPGNIQVLREGTAALNSVFTSDDLKNFTAQKEQFKEKQLKELLCIVSGIRIFNKDCGKGGESIPELTVNLSEAAEATSLALSHCLIRIMERVNLLTTTIDNFLFVNPESKSMEVVLPEGGKVGIEDYANSCKILAVYRQYEILVRKLIGSMDHLQVENKELGVNFSTHMFDLHALVRYRTAIPVDQVFPYFIRLWSYWRRMQDNMFVISAINNIMWGLDGVHEKLETPHSTIDLLLGGRRIMSDAQRMQQTEERKLEQVGNKCQVIDPTDKLLGDCAYQYLGFCSLCICVGALIPANPYMGLMKWGKCYYAFCSPEHGKIFGSNPNRYVRDTLEYIRNNVELVNFLQIYEDLYVVRQIPKLAIKFSHIQKTDDKAVQTELHPIPSYIDKDYFWNIWDFKRRICQMANIVKCQTHSTQTYCSPSFVEHGCQTDHKVNKINQTTADKQN